VLLLGEPFMIATTTETFWKDLHSLLQRFIRSRVRDENLVDDLIQETFLRIHKNLASLKDPKKLSHWALTIARRSIADAFRARKHEGLKEEPISQIREQAVDQELFDCVTKSLLASLPEKYRVAIQRVELDGLSQKALADELGLSVSAAKSRVQRGRALIKKTLLKSCELEFDSRGSVIDYYCEPDKCALLCNPES
ncbi:MAG: sigma-70 family RNA polymerase sigma factor, partial [Planctomycetota bacterium]|nr:sigma-70 family RNA polymerase sigma factor [Planctomycetota bacterium]